MDKKSLMFCLVFLLVLSLSFASAGFFGDFFSKITGKNVKQLEDSPESSTEVPATCKEDYICLDENFRAYQNSDCSLGKGIYCGNGCSAGECVEVIEQEESNSEQISNEKISSLELVPFDELKNNTLNCIDSDGGREYFVKGSTTGIKGKEQSLASYVDFCFSSEILTERYCGENNYVFEENHSCSYGCEEGVCLTNIQTTNKKDLSKYSEKEVFLISDKNWKDVLSLVPVAVWTEEVIRLNVFQEDLSLSGHIVGEPSGGLTEESFVKKEVSKYPLLIYHEEIEKPINLVSDAWITTSLSQVNNPSSGLVDGDLETSWNSGSGDEAWIKIDLQSMEEFDRIDIFNTHHSYSISISVSNDDINYQILSEDYILEIGWNTFELNNEARFIKMVIDENLPSEPRWKAINEIGIYLEEQTESYESFDADSIIYFMQQYDAQKVTIIGDSPIELDNLLIVQPELGVGLNHKNQIKRISANDYLSYWEDYKDVIYVKDNYELSLMASTYASLIGAPLIIEGTALDEEINFENKNVICVWKTIEEFEVQHSRTSGKIIDSFQGEFPSRCDEKYNLDQLQQKYVDETHTDKIMLVNPNDLNIKVIEEFQPEKSGNPIYEIYSKTSLAAPILASAKHEVIISTTATDYREIDSFIEEKVYELLGSDFFDCNSNVCLNKETSYFSTLIRKTENFTFYLFNISSNETIMLESFPNISFTSNFVFAGDKVLFQSENSFNSEDSLYSY
jgi:hypothetical protein